MNRIRSLVLAIALVVASLTGCGALSEAADTVVGDTEAPTADEAAQACRAVAPEPAATAVVVLPGEVPALTTLVDDLEVLRPDPDELFARLSVDGVDVAGVVEIVRPDATGAGQADRFDLRRTGDNARNADREARTRRNCLFTALASQPAAPAPPTTTTTANDPSATNDPGAAADPTSDGATTAPDLIGRLDGIVGNARRTAGAEPVTVWILGLERSQLAGRALVGIGFTDDNVESVLDQFEAADVPIPDLSSLGPTSVQFVDPGGGLPVQARTNIRRLATALCGRLGATDCSIVEGM